MEKGCIRKDLQMAIDCLIPACHELGDRTLGQRIDYNTFFPPRWAVNVRVRAFSAQTKPSVARLYAIISYNSGGVDRSEFDIFSGGPPA